MLVRGPTEDGQGLGIVRKRGEKVQVGELRATAEGKPLQGELVRLHAREAPGLYDVEVLYDATTQAPAPATDVASRPHAGPARVTTDEYRDGWERVFRRTRDLSN